MTSLSPHSPIKVAWVTVPGASAPRHLLQRRTHHGGGGFGGGGQLPPPHSLPDATALAAAAPLRPLCHITATRCFLGLFYKEQSLLLKHYFTQSLLDYYYQNILDKDSTYFSCCDVSCS